MASHFWWNVAIFFCRGEGSKFSNYNFFGDFNKMVFYIRLINKSKYIQELVVIYQAPEIQIPFAFFAPFRGEFVPN